jgi:hypothetical protein
MRKEAEMQDSDLDDLFATARREPAAVVSVGLMARVMADAEAHQPRAAKPLAAAPRGGFWRGALSAIGGAGALAGLSTATLAGVWIGFVQPSAVIAVTEAFGVEGSLIETVDVLPTFDDFLTEG